MSSSLETSRGSSNCTQARQSDSWRRRQEQQALALVADEHVVAVGRGLEPAAYGRVEVGGRHPAARRQQDRLALRRRDAQGHLTVEEHGEAGDRRREHLVELLGAWRGRRRCGPASSRRMRDSRSRVSSRATTMMKPACSAVPGTLAARTCTHASPPPRLQDAVAVVLDGLAGLQQLHASLVRARSSGVSRLRDPPRVGRRRAARRRGTSRSAREGVVDLDDESLGVDDDERLLDGTRGSPAARRRRATASERARGWPRAGLAAPPARNGLTT